jgi:hypothetical protein
MELKNIKLLLDNHDFASLYNYLADKNEEQVSNLLFVTAYDDQNLTTYTFANFAIAKNESSKWHFVASFLMAMAFNHLEYGYQIAFYHAKKAIELNPTDLSLKEYILLFYSIPEKLLPQATAVQYAKEILLHNHDSKAARFTLDPNSIA